MLFLPGTNVDMVHHHRQPETVAKILDKADVLICLFSPESVMDVGRCQLNPLAAPQTVEEVAESNRVRAAGDGHQNPIARLEHPVLCYGFLDLLQ